MERTPSRTIVAEALSASAFEEYGWLPVEDTDPRDGSHRLDFAWGDPHLNVISHGAGEVRRVSGGTVCHEMFRHLSHTQALLVLDREAVFAVAPAGVDFSREEDVESIRAFRLGVLDALVLGRGTWHWGPFPLGEEPVHLYNVQGLGYERDNDRVDLTGFGLVVSTPGRAGT